MYLEARRVEGWLSMLLRQGPGRMYCLHAGGASGQTVSGAVSVALMGANDVQSEFGVTDWLQMVFDG